VSTNLHQTMDARVWAAEFCATFRKVHPEQPCPDEGWILGWMANAIMCGWDHAHWQMARQRNEAVIADLPPSSVLAGSIAEVIAACTVRPVSALVLVPTWADVEMTIRTAMGPDSMLNIDGAEVNRKTGTIRWPNGSTLHLRSATGGEARVVGLALDVAYVAPGVPDDMRAEVRRRLLRGGAR
jgi:hypothetical protein